MATANNSQKMATRLAADDNPTLFEMSQEQLTSDDYYTPPEFFDDLGLHFDIDVAAPAGGCDWIPANTYFDQTANGLTSDWYGNVFMNPPFSQTALWVDKFIKHGCGVAIVPVTRAHWFNNAWKDPKLAFAIPHQDKTLFRFINKGKRVGVFMPVIVIAIGDSNQIALRKVGFVR